jgi:hypothetical protein
VNYVQQEFCHGDFLFFFAGGKHFYEVSRSYVVSPLHSMVMLGFMFFSPTLASYFPCMLAGYAELIVTSSSLKTPNSVQ